MLRIATQQQLTTAAYIQGQTDINPCSACAGLLPALLFGGIGVAVYYASLIRKETARLCKELTEFYAKNETALREHGKQMAENGSLVQMRSVCCVVTCVVTLPSVQASRCLEPCRSRLTARQLCPILCPVAVWLRLHLRGQRSGKPA